MTQKRGRGKGIRHPSALICSLHRPLSPIFQLPSSFSFQGSYTASPRLARRFMSTKFYRMTMRIDIDCGGCYRKIRRALLKIQELESHLIEKQQSRVSVCGAFDPQDVAIKLRKMIKRRVEIMEIKETDLPA